MPDEKQGAGTRRGRLYGRKWKITIYKPAYKEEVKVNEQNLKITVRTRDPEHDTAIDVSSLRCIFKTNQTTLTKATICALEVYNMNAATEGEIIKEGFQISIEAGYDEGQYGEIFTGDIAQVIRNRENGVDYKLEILALRGSAMFDVNHTRCKIAAGSKPREIISAIAQNSKVAIDVGEVSDNLSDQKLPRGKVLFGTPGKYLRDLTIGNNAYFWAGEDNKLVVKKTADEIPEGEVLELTPATGLVGTPQYGDDGIHITMLLDSRVKLMTMIKIDNDIIRKQLINLNLTGAGNNQLPQQSIFDKDGEYQVFSVSHHGDTYGDEWTTSVVGIGRQGRQGILISLDDAGQSER